MAQDFRDLSCYLVNKESASLGMFKTHYDHILKDVNASAPYFLNNKVQCLFFKPALFLFPLQAFLHRIRQTADDQQCLSPEHVKVRLQPIKQTYKYLKWLVLTLRCSDMVFIHRFAFFPHISVHVLATSLLFSLSSFHPASLSLPSSVSPSLYIIPLFIDSVFKYWGHPGVAQRGVVCSGGHSAARTPASACTGTRVPPVCKCMTHTKTHIKQQTVTQIHKHMDTHVGAHACMNSSSMQTHTHTNSFHGLPVTTDAGKACKACCENTP